MLVEMTMKHLVVLRLFTGFALATTLSGSDGPRDSQARPGARDGTSRIQSQSWMVDGARRTGLVATPLKYPADGAPLVLVFHGHGGTAANMSRALPIHARWPEALVIYLQGLPTPGRIVDPKGRGAGWQSAPGAHGDRDIALVDSVIAWAVKTQKVDPKRIFAAGHSNGGWFTYVLWSTRPERFAAFAPASATLGKMLTTVKPKPAIILAGEKDRVVPYAGQRRTIAAVVDLNQATTLGEAWYGGARLHRSPIADVATYVYPGAHPLPSNASDVVTRFFQRF
jgi:polyhydroxybutyrate depolymerase